MICFETLLSIHRIYMCELYSTYEQVLNINNCNSLKSLAAIAYTLCVALSRNLKLTTTLDRAITQSPCYVPLNLER